MIQFEFNKKSFPPLKTNTPPAVWTEEHLREMEGISLKRIETETEHGKGWEDAMEVVDRFIRSKIKKT